MLHPLRMKQEKDKVLLLNASAFFYLANLIRKDTGELFISVLRPGDPHQKKKPENSPRWQRRL
jgi:hypothetical protein